MRFISVISFGFVKIRTFWKRSQNHYISKRFDLRALYYLHHHTPLPFMPKYQVVVGFLYLRFFTIWITISIFVTVRQLTDIFDESVFACILGWNLADFNWIKGKQFHSSPCMVMCALCTMLYGCGVLFIWFKALLEPHPDKRNAPHFLCLEAIPLEQGTTTLKRWIALRILMIGRRRHMSPLPVAS